MGKLSFKDSLKALEADIQHANTLYSLSYFFFSFKFFWHGLIKVFECVIVLYLLSTTDAWMASVLWIWSNFAAFASL